MDAFFDPPSLTRLSSTLQMRAERRAMVCMFLPSPIPSPECRRHPRPLYPKGTAGVSLVAGRARCYNLAVAWSGRDGTTSSSVLPSFTLPPRSLKAIGYSFLIIYDLSIETKIYCFICRIFGEHYPSMDKLTSTNKNNGQY